MKQLITSLFLVAITTNFAFGQDTTYFDKNWDKIESSIGATYYRILTPENKRWKVQDFYISGTLQMKGYYTSLDEETKEGLFEFYHPSSLPKETLFYKGDKEYQVQVWNDEGKEVLVNGSGEFHYQDEDGNPSLKVYKDSVLTYGYSLEKNTKDKIYFKTEKNAEPKGGFENLYKYIGQNIDYPKAARRNGTEGKVFVQFVVRVDGSMTNFRIIKGIGSGCDEEVIRVLQGYKDWQPGTVNGEKVNQLFIIPVAFRLN